ncbi:unnamed protein product [Danaus chrysippus]|uniref:(African queen) hypothetical protein n=1 Tax=Danaus chrysippus TaxID=151541 RepID=A0A8J2QID5_9NEOP|nr:unnamed protein product [Danaus chrysippus]
MMTSYRRDSNSEPAAQPYHVDTSQLIPVNVSESAVCVSESADYSNRTSEASVGDRGPAAGPLARLALYQLLRATLR